MARLIALLALTQLKPAQPGAGKCPQPAWWRSADEHPCSAVDDALAQLRPAFSAAPVRGAVSGRASLVCPDGAVLVNSWVERRTGADGDARVLAPAPDCVDACFGRPSCELPSCAGSLCDLPPRAPADTNGSRDVRLALDEPGGDFRAAIAGSCASLHVDGSLYSDAPAKDSVARSPASAAASAAAASLAASAAANDAADNESAEADDIVPLEEWKAQVLAKLAEQEAQAGRDLAETDMLAAADGAAGGLAPIAHEAHGGSTAATPSALSAAAETAAAIASSRARLPLKQRFNYGAFDAGARLVAANPEAKGASAILKTDKDTYMLNPCSARKWVVIALPEDIKVDAVSFSNHELFASAVREWQLLGSMKYPTDLWFELGKFEAADSKQPQAFHLATPSWARYLKVRFITHHRAEHYCTLSQLGVFGQTVMDEFAESMEVQTEKFEDMRKRVHSAATTDGPVPLPPLASAAEHDLVAPPPAAPPPLPPRAPEPPAAADGAATSASAAAELVAAPDAEPRDGSDASAAQRPIESEGSDCKLANGTTAIAAASAAALSREAAAEAGSGHAALAADGTQLADAPSRAPDGSSQGAAGPSAAAPAQPPPLDQPRAADAPSQPAQPAGAAEAAVFPALSGAHTPSTSSSAARGDAPREASAAQVGADAAAAAGHAETAAAAAKAGSPELAAEATTARAEPSALGGVPPAQSTRSEPLEPSDVAQGDGALAPRADGAASGEAVAAAVSSSEPTSASDAPARSDDASAASGTDDARRGDAATAGLPGGAGAREQPRRPGGNGGNGGGWFQNAAAAIGSLVEGVMKPAAAAERAAARADALARTDAALAAELAASKAARAPPRADGADGAPPAADDAAGSDARAQPLAVGSAEGGADGVATEPPAPHALAPSCDGQLAAAGVPPPPPSSSQAAPRARADDSRAAAAAAPTPPPAGELVPAVAESATPPSASSHVVAAPPQPATAGATGESAERPPSLEAPPGHAAVERALLPLQASTGGGKEGVLKLLTTQMHTLELNISLTSLWLTEFNQRNNATLTDVKRRIARVREEALALGAQVRALEETDALRASATLELQAELHAVDSQFSLLVSTIERQNALYARDLERVRQAARSELVVALLGAAALALALQLCSARGGARGGAHERWQQQQLLRRRDSEPVTLVSSERAPRRAPLASPAGAARQAWRAFLEPTAHGQADPARVPQTRSLDSLRIEPGAGHGAAPDTSGDLRRLLLPPAGPASSPRAPPTTGPRPSAGGPDGLASSFAIDEYGHGKYADVMDAQRKYGRGLLQS